MHGKLCLITGATSGIGQATAHALAASGAVVIIHGRDARRLQATRNRIRASTGQDVAYLSADLASQAQIREMVSIFYSRNGHLDVLVNNAAAVFVKREHSEDGIEKTFAVNHLSHFMLTLMLLPALRKSPAARIINVSSGSHRTAIIDWDNLQLRNNYGGMKAYAQSKLANILFTYELARQVHPAGITVNALNPGGVRTRIGMNNGPLVRIAMLLGGILWQSAEDGAKTSIYLASSPEVAEVTGKYFEHCEIVPSSGFSYDRSAAQQLWAISAEMVGFTESAKHYQ